jgi:hypothetical protein
MNLLSSWSLFPSRGPSGGCDARLAIPQAGCLLVAVCFASSCAHFRDPLREAVERDSESVYAFFMARAPDYRIVPVPDHPFKAWAAYKCRILGTSHSPIEFCFAYKPDEAVILTGNLSGLNRIIREEHMTMDLQGDLAVRLWTYVRPMDRRFWRLGIDAVDERQIDLNAISAAGDSLSDLTARSGTFVEPGTRRFFVIERRSLMEYDVSLRDGGLSIRGELLVEDVIKDSF